MHYSKLRISADAASKLRFMRQRTGLTPNLLCRIALMSSLEQGSLRDTQPPDEEGLEFNAYTLTGEYGALFAGMLRFVEEAEGTLPELDDETLLGLMRAHIHRGVGTISVRAKSSLDVLRLIPGEAVA